MSLTQTIAQWKAKLVPVVGKIAAGLAKVGFYTLAWIVMIGTVCLGAVILTKILRVVFSHL